MFVCYDVFILLFCQNLVIPSFRKRESSPCIHAQQDYEHGLNCMYDEHKDECLMISHTIENQHGLDGEMPGTCTIRRGHDNGKVCHHKRYHGASKTKIGREIKAEER